MNLTDIKYKKKIQIVTNDKIRAKKKKTLLKRFLRY